MSKVLFVIVSMSDCKTYVVHFVEFLASLFAQIIFSFFGAYLDFLHLNSILSWYIFKHIQKDCLLLFYLAKPQQ